MGLRTNESEREELKGRDEGGREGCKKKEIQRARGEKTDEAEHALHVRTPSLYTVEN